MERTELSIQYKSTNAYFTNHTGEEKTFGIGVFTFPEECLNQKIKIYSMKFLLPSCSLGGINLSCNDKKTRIFMNLSMI